jgi:drug/metabolite transporter (DMT)-like permease
MKVRSRWRRWTEVLFAVVGGVVLYNLHPTRLGNALTARYPLAEGAESEGLSLEGRIALYAVIAVVGAVLLTACVLMQTGEARQRDAHAAARSAGLLCLAGIAGLALDYRDGPQSWVHLLAFVAVILCTLRVARLTGLTRSH